MLPNHEEVVWFLQGLLICLKNWQVVTTIVPKNIREKAELENCRGCPAAMEMPEIDVDVNLTAMGKV